MKSKIFLSIILVLCLIFVTCIIGCNKDDGGNDTNTDTGTNTSTGTDTNTDTNTDTQEPKEPDGFKLTLEGEASYKIIIVDYQNEPVKDAVVKITLGDGASIMDFVNSDGSTTKTLKAGDNYIVAESSVTKKAYYLVQQENANGEIKFCAYTELDASRIHDSGTPDDGTPESIADDRVAYITRETGSYYATGLEGKKTVFFLFIPTQDGVYEFSANVAGIVGYYAAPINAVQQPIAPFADENGVLSMEIKKKNLGDSAESTTPYLVGFTADDESIDECLFTIHRAGDPVYTIDDEPYTYLTNPFNPEPFFAGYRNWSVALNDIDISLAVNAVYNENDGYYHLGSADGEIIYVRITTDSKYLPAFTKVCETSLMSCYIYEGETFIKKEAYNLLVNQYSELCDEATGLYPLDRFMATAIQNHGNAAGWWNSKSLNYLFGEDAVNIDSAWLFACCTITIDENAGKDPLAPIQVEKSVPTDIITELVMVDSDTTLYFEQITKLDSKLTVKKCGENVKVIYNGEEYTPTNGTITVNIVKNTALTFEIVNEGDEQVTIELSIS